MWTQMRIGIIDTEISGSLIGGAQIFLAGLLKGIADRGHETHFVSKGIPTEKSSEKIKRSNAVLHVDLWNGLGLVDNATPKFAKWANDLRLGRVCGFGFAGYWLDGGTTSGWKHCNADDRLQR